MSTKIHITSEDDAELKRKEIEKEKRLQELEDIKWILSDPRGMRFWKRFFILSKVFSTSMTGNSWTFFNEGQRNFSLQYLKDIAEACPEKIPELILCSEGLEGEKSGVKTDQ